MAAATDRYPPTALDELLLSPANKVSHLCFNACKVKRVALVSNLASNEYQRTDKICFHLFQVLGNSTFRPSHTAQGGWDGRMDRCMVKDDKRWKMLEKTRCRALRRRQEDNIKIYVTELGYKRGWLVSNDVGQVRRRGLLTTVMKFRSTWQLGDYLVR